MTVLGDREVGGASLPSQATVLTGFSVAITACRRREELAGLLERRGARVISAPAVQIRPLADDTELVAATRACIAAPPAIVIASTGVGFRGWMEAADGWGLGDALRRVLDSANVLARGPKAMGAIRAAGLRESWSPVSESLREVLDHLRAGDIRGVRIAVQLHGDPEPELIEGLRATGADVIPVPVYRWRPPEDVGPLMKLVELVATRNVDAVAFTSKPAVQALLDLADQVGRREAVLAAFRGDVVPACVGMVTAEPLELIGVKTLQPDRPRLGALVRVIAEELPRRRPEGLMVGGHRLEIRGHAVLVDQRMVDLPPAPMAVLRALAEQPGRVMSRAQLVPRLPSGDAASEHAVEMAVTRLRAALGDGQCVQTVVKRGYRLRVE
ncbi:uroporphyrinogen-III synthase [Sporichthya polymorpha]|uniref:uroporphyrinogen-III synthase n=1 Tax=Sporichthya polymorpha TaxID=35751 RepID=UPI000380764B|nr:uroporphyrinogen-III synthase [Sporichthya polymorpha]